MLTGLQSMNGKVIEHTLYDAFTLQCLLQFIYEGDYSTCAAAVHTKIDTGANGHLTNGHNENTPPPHLHKTDVRAPALKPPVQSPSIPPENAMEAHVLIYGIATHCETSASTSCSMTGRHC